MTRLLDTDVRFISNVEATAKLMNEWGSLTQVLDEVLTRGSNEQQILSITTVEDPEDSRYWLSTIVLNAGHKFEKELHVVSLSGVSVNEYNNVFRVLLWTFIKLFSTYFRCNSYVYSLFCIDYFTFSNHNCK